MPDMSSKGILASILGVAALISSACTSQPSTSNPSPGSQSRDTAHRGNEEALFVAIDFSKSSESTRTRMIDWAIKEAGAHGAKNIGVIGFGSTANELYFGAPLTNRELVGKAKAWIKESSFQTEGTDLSQPFLLVESLLKSAKLNPGTIAISVYTDAGTELMTSEMRKTLTESVTRLNQSYGLTQVSVVGVRSGASEGFKRVLRELFSETPVTLEISDL